MCFFDLVQQQDGMRVLIDLVGQKSALIIAHIAGRRADEPGDRMALHIFAHVKAQKFQTLSHGQLTGDFGFTHTGRSGKEVRADGLVGFTQSSARQFDGGSDLFDGRILSKDNPFEIRFEGFERFGIVPRQRFRRYAGDFRDHIFDFFNANSFFALVFWLEPLARPRLVNNVDGFVRQFAVRHMANGQRNRLLYSVIGIFNLVKLLEIGLQPHEDFDGVITGGLGDVHFQKAPRQSPVFFKMLTVFLVSG